MSEGDFRNVYARGNKSGKFFNSEVCEVNFEEIDERLDKEQQSYSYAIVSDFRVCVNEEIMLYANFWAS